MTVTGRDPIRRQGYDPRIPERWTFPEPVSARKLNQLADSIADIYGGISPARVLSRQLSESPPAQFKSFVVAEVRGDYILCQPGQQLDAGRSDNYVPVAKPYLMRRTPFEGLTRNGITYTYEDEEGNDSDSQRVASDVSDSTLNEDQEIVPEYVAGDVIYAARNVEGGTGVKTEEGDGTPVEWIDMNFDSRAWASA